MNLTGRWIGQTQEKDTERHMWLFVQRGQHFDLYTRWESEYLWRAHFKGDMLESKHFIISSWEEDRYGTITDSDQIIVHKWIGKYEGEQWVPAYDVLFRRQDHGIKKHTYTLLINVLLLVKLIGKVLRLQRLFYDPVILIK